MPRAAGTDQHPSGGAKFQRDRMDDDRRGGLGPQTQAPAGSMGGGLGGGSVLQTSTTSGFRHGGRRGFWRWLFGLR